MALILIHLTPCNLVNMHVSMGNFLKTRTQLNQNHRDTDESNKDPHRPDAITQQRQRQIKLTPQRKESLLDMYTKYFTMLNSF